MPRFSRLPAFAPAFVLLVCAALPSVFAADDPKLNPREVEFFEKKIRPVLVDHCYSCHSAEAEKIKGGLRLDSRETVLAGGESGPAIVPGNPERSLLIKAVRYTDEDLQMPPKGKKLSDEQIADLVAWVKMGAPDPRTAPTAAAPPSEIELAAKNHWAFQPVREPAIPEVKNSRWVKSPVDAFILAELEKGKLKPSPAADKRTLIRRATFDLIGLPPTPGEVEAFLNDKSPDSFARVVERLLASPHYGERWGRHWLDVARYADTMGEQNQNADTRYLYSYTYRDYVIRAFNEDKPYDEFILEQIAADRLPDDGDKRKLAALGFLTLGNRFRNSTHDVIDDRIDVVTRGLLGLSVSCARCHDHKFDPIPTRDYYSLHGVFNSTTEPDELPLIEPLRDAETYHDFLAKVGEREAELQKLRDENEAEILGKIRKQAADYLLAVHEVEQAGKDISKSNFYRQRDLDPNVAQNWETAVKRWQKEHHPALLPWFAFAALSKKDFAARAKPLSAEIASGRLDDRPVNPLVARAFAGKSPASLKDVAAIYEQLFKTVSDDESSGARVAKSGGGDQKSDEVGAAKSSEFDREAVRALLFGPDSPVRVESRDLRRLTKQQVQREENDLIRKVNDVKWSHPGSPARAMMLEDVSRPRDSYVFIRGNAGSRGPVVPRQFLEIIEGEDRKPFADGSGRLDLAKAIVRRDNPLTARVMVNRIWLHHFGTGIVPTPSDFGLRSEPPSHPELLDYLAWRFMEDGWSIKNMHRLIMLSNVYQQRSDSHTAGMKADPGNRLLWRMSRRRLDFEAMRDTLLAVSGQLDRAMGGTPVELTKLPVSNRRTVYGFINRQAVPEMMVNFDVASPDTSSPQRYVTTVPQQALFMMNSPFVVEQAKALIQRDEFAALPDDEARIRALYRDLFQRAPDKAELQSGLEFLKSQERFAVERIAETAWKYGYGQYDPAKKRVRQFSALKTFARDTWQGGKSLGDLTLDATGGQTGVGPKQAVIRRWTAPHDGVIAIDAMLRHKSSDGGGAGVHARVVSSRHGELGSWTANDSEVPTTVARVEIRKGDTIDFVVESVDAKGEIGESFVWSPALSLIDRDPNDAPAEVHEWNAEANFTGSPDQSPKGLAPWEKYAHVLLLTNELIFVN